MDKRILLVVALLFVLLAGLSAPAYSLCSFIEGSGRDQLNSGSDIEKSTITVDLSQTTTKISPFIYGQFIEYLGRCIDGGIYEEGSALSGQDGFRKDVLKAVQEL